MTLQVAGHECDRFGIRGIACPFRRSREDEDDEPDEEGERRAHRNVLPIALPGRRSDADQDRQLRNITNIAVAPKELREALERMAAFKNIGGLPSIPSFPFEGRGHQSTISVLTAIALMTAFRALRSRGLGQGLPMVRAGERHVSKGLQRVLSPRGSGNPARTQGRGGIHVNAAANLRQLLFGRRKVGGPAAGFDAFSETGFN